MQKESKIALLGFSLGFVLFVLSEKLVFSKKGIASAPPAIQDKDIQAASVAYGEALANNEPASVLQSLNEEFATRYNLQVHERASDQTLVITDMAGTQIATYQP